MATKSAADSFIGLGGLIVISTLLSLPLLGWTGIICGLAAIYICVVMVNGADSAANRRSQKQNRRRRR